jgi:hypothetical protein
MPTPGVCPSHHVARPERDRPADERISSATPKTIWAVDES